MTPAYNVRGLDGPLLPLRPRFAPVGGPWEVEALTGEIARATLIVGSLTLVGSNRTVLDVRTGQSDGSIDSNAFPSETVAINRIRYASEISFTINRGGGGSFSTWRGENTDNSVFVYTSAEDRVELRIEDSTAGGGFMRFAIAESDDNTITDAEAVDEFLSAIETGQRVVLVLAPKTEDA